MIQGFKDNIRNFSVKNYKENMFITAGKDLDEISINLSLHTQEDVDNLIQFLTIAKPTLEKKK